MASLEDIVRRHNAWESAHKMQSPETSSSSSPPFPPSTGIVHTHRARRRDAPVSAAHLIEPAQAEAPQPSQPQPQRDTGATPSPSLASPSPPFAMPFTPYPVQRDMMRAITDTLLSSGAAATPIVATEVPTGCGKTLALFSSVLQYQAAVKRMTPREAERHFAQRSFRSSTVGKQTAATRKGYKAKGGHTGKDAGHPSRTEAKEEEEGEGEGEESDDWSVPLGFFKQFRVDRTKRLRAEVDLTGSSELRRRFTPPPCTIFYATRTHAQLSQAVRELRRLMDGPSSSSPSSSSPACPVPHSRAVGTGGSAGHADHTNPLLGLRSNEDDPRKHYESGVPFLPTPTLRMNILGSRERYCIHPTIRRATANHTLPVEGNNLGEVCDKLVSLGQCECVHGYGELACSAIDGGAPIGMQKAAQLAGKAKGGASVWDLEDLVMEGVAQRACPYYAARDLVFYADITLCTYNYLLDPLIRHECHMDSALRNNAIVVLDEAHNVPAVCQDALSLSSPMHVLATIQEEMHPLVMSDTAGAGTANATAQQQQQERQQQTHHHQESSAYASYQRNFKLAHYSLTEVFTFLFTVFRAVEDFFVSLPLVSVDGGEGSGGEVAAATATDGGFPSASSPTTADSCRGERLAEALSQKLGEFVRRHQLHLRVATTGNDRARAKKAAVATASEGSKFCWLPLFKSSYALIMALGVTFNPFNLSIFALSQTKRWMLILRFLLQKPKAFALARTRPPKLSAQSGPGISGVGGHPTAHARPSSVDVCEVRCLDGSLAFHHLLRDVHRAVLASGTLAPFPQLASDLGLTQTAPGYAPATSSGNREGGELVPFRAFDGLHVVGEDQYLLRALTKLSPHERGHHPPPQHSAFSFPLHCTYANLGTGAFLKDLAFAVYRLCTTVPAGGVLVFAPNYRVMEQLFALTKAFLTHNTKWERHHRFEALAEPRKALELPAVLDYFKALTTSKRAAGLRPSTALSVNAQRVERGVSATATTTAILFSVYRGKVSEGIDFTDDMARLVICVGVPMQPLRSWTVKAQRAYSGPEWYTTDAVRAVNQALGRCLRHIHDYGAVVLLDDRYAGKDHQQRLSRWCRDAIVVDESAQTLCEDLVAFFAAQRAGDSGCSAAAGEGPEGPADMSTHPSIPEDGEAVACGSVLSARLGTEQLPFHHIPRQHPRGAGRQASASPPPQQQRRRTSALDSIKDEGNGNEGSDPEELKTERRSLSPAPSAPPAVGVERRRSQQPQTRLLAAAPAVAAPPLHRHPWSATALKLLSEEASPEEGEEKGPCVTADGLRSRLQELEEMFPADRGE